MSDRIDFSVIIPSFNRPDALSSCLAAVRGLNYPPERFEIIVIDDGSTASYGGVENEFPEVNFLAIKNSGPGVARNVGANSARGRYLAFTDDDCYVHPDWLSKLRETFAVHPSSLVGGSTPAHPETNLYDRVSQFITGIVYEHYNSWPEKAEFFASNNLAICRELFLELNGFPTCHTKNAAEDRSLCNLAISANKRLVWNREAVVFHKPDLDLPKFCRMYFRYGRGAYTYQKGRKTGSFLGEMRFHANLPAAVWRGLADERSLPVGPTLGLLFLWQVCNLGGFLWQTLRGDEF